MSAKAKSAKRKLEMMLEKAAEEEENRNRSAKKQSVDHQSAVIHQQKLLLAFWSELDDRLLMAWIIDYQVNGSKEQKKVALRIDYALAQPKSERSHEYLVQFLVQNSEALGPPLGAPVKSSKETDFKKAIANLQNVWQALNRLESNSLAKTAWPAKYHEAAESDEEDHADNENGDLDAAHMHDVHKPSASPAKGAKSSRSSSSSVQQLTCRSCGGLRHAVEADEAASIWMCRRMVNGVVCGLRGDLEPSHSTNVGHLERLQADKKAAASNSSAAAASVDAGENSKNTREKQYRNRMETEFRQQLSTGEPFTEFTKDATSDAVELSKMALKMQRMSSAGALDYDPPNEVLLQLIRAGKLTSVGWCLPRAKGAKIDVEFFL
jgi:hypothetical protein